MLNSTSNACDIRDLEVGEIVLYHHQNGGWGTMRVEQISAQRVYASPNYGTVRNSILINYQDYYTDKMRKIARGREWDNEENKMVDDNI